MKALRLPVTVLALALTVPACGGGGASTPTAQAGDGTIGTALKDLAITLEEHTTPAGSTTFDITNDGPSTHEFVVFRSDLAEDALPVDGSTVTEDDLDLVDEVEDIAPGVGATLTLDLEPGAYVVICNVQGHYTGGMHASLSVT